jgi:hypothetical protein
LYLLELNIAANPIAQIALIIHWSGVAQLAIARDKDKGILTIATTIPDFRFLFVCSKTTFIIFISHFFYKINVIAFIDFHPSITTKKNYPNWSSLLLLVITFT